MYALRVADLYPASSVSPSSRVGCVNACELRAVPRRSSKNLWKRMSLTHWQLHATVPAGDEGTKSLPTEATSVKFVSQKFSSLVLSTRYRIVPNPSAPSQLV